MFDRLKNLLRAPEAKASRVGRLIQLESGGRARWTPREFAALAREGYMQNAIVYRSVRLVAESAASLTFLLYEGAAEIDRHPLLDLLARPNPRQDGATLFEAIYSSLLLAGNAYVEAVTLDGQGTSSATSNAASSVRELYALRADRMRVVPGPDGWPEAYEYTVAGRTVRFDQSGPLPPILQLALFHPLDDHYGLPPLEAAAIAVEGGDGNLRYKLSKESAAKTLSFLFQDNFSGRAEIGLTGDDDFHFKVSPDGSTWTEAIVVDRTTGGIRFRAAETSVASASTCDIGAAASLKVAIIGTTTITSFGTAPHALRFIKFAAALTLTHNATTLVLPGAANIAVAANDRAIAVSDGSGNWYVVAYQRANGKAVIGPAAADVTDSTSVGRALLTATDAPTARAAIYAAPIDALAFNGMQINGAMEASQENGTGAVTLTATGSLQTKYLLDGVMAAYRGSFVATAQQVTSPFAGGRYALKFTVGTAEASLGANDELSVFIPFEGVRVSRLALGTANAAFQSLGFWCQEHRTGTYSGSIRNAGKTRSYPFTFTIGAADTPTWVSLSGVNAIPGDTTGTWAIDTSVGMYVSICLAGGSSRVGSANAWAGSDYSGATGTTNGVAATSDVFTIGNLIAVPGIELPAADRAAFIMRPIDQELLLCKRYYVSLGGESTAQKFVSGICLFSTGFLGPVTLQTDMRAQPSVSYSNLSDFQIVYSGGSTTTPTAIAMDWNSVRVPTLSITTASVLTAGQAGLLQSASTSARLKFDSRL
jgi:hypothetical protein